MNYIHGGTKTYNLLQKNFFFFCIYIQFAGEKWKAWPTSSTLNDFINSNQDLDFLTNTMKDYVKTVNDLLHELEDGLESARTNALTAMNSLADLLEEFRKTAQISPQFVL